MSISDGHGTRAEHMLQVCSWHADDHDTHVQEHVLTHTHGLALGGMHRLFVRCMCFGVGMVLIFPVFPLTGRFFPGPCVSVSIRVPVHVHACSHARGRAVSFSCFSVCARVHLWLCVCCRLPGHRRRASAWAAAGSAVTLCVRAGLRPGACSGLCPDRAGAAPRDASPDTPPVSVCRKGEDGEGTARCQAFFLHKQGYLGPIGA